MISYHQILRENGLRNTKQRTIIFDSITEYPKTVFEIYENLQKQKKSVDLVTIYRTLDVFTKLRIVAQIDFGDGIRKYERVQSDNHHHHLVCEMCGSIEDIRLNESDIFKHTRIPSGFFIQRHNFEFFGLCKSCNNP